MEVGENNCIKNKHWRLSGNISSSMRSFLAILSDPPDLQKKKKKIRKITMVKIYFDKTYHFMWLNMTKYVQRKYIQEMPVLDLDT